VPECTYKSQHSFNTILESGRVENRLRFLKIAVKLNEGTYVSSADVFSEGCHQAKPVLTWLDYMSSLKRVMLDCCAGDFGWIALADNHDAAWERVEWINISPLLITCSTWMWPKWVRLETAHDSSDVGVESYRPIHAKRNGKLMITRYDLFVDWVLWAGTPCSVVGSYRRFGELVAFIFRVEMA
jgi:hypothetical protein